MKPAMDSRPSLPLSRAARAFLGLAIILDLGLVNLSFVATSLVKFGSPFPTDDFLPIYLRLHLFMLLAVPAALTLTGAYRDLYRSSLGHQATSAAKACLWASGATLLALFLLRHIGYSRTFVVAHLAQITLLLPFSRLLLGRIADRWRASGIGVRPVMLVGDREAVLEVGLRLRLASHLGYRVAAIYPQGWRPAPAELAQLQLVSDPAAMAECLASHGIERVFVCDHTVERRKHKAVIEAADEAGVDVRLIVCPVLIPDYRTRIHDILAVPLGSRLLSPSRWPSSRGKRAFDLLASLGLLAVLAPIILLIALAVRLSSRGPIFYRQRRLGREGRAFELIKFRSMVARADYVRPRLSELNEATGPLFKLRRDPRVTPVGQWLRKLSLDELPQLWNVVRGEMSLVGPRPPLPEEVERYEAWQRLRLKAPQGLTGLWQVSGRSRLSFEEMVLLDLYYLENASLLLDLEILMETLPTVLHGDGAF